MKGRKTAFASGFSSLPHSSGGSRGGARGARPPPPLFLDQTGARRAEKNFFGDCSPALFQGLDDRVPPLSQGLNPAMH